MAYYPDDPNFANAFQRQFKRSIGIGGGPDMMAPKRVDQSHSTLPAFNPGSTTDVTPPGPWVGGNGVTPPGPWVGGNGVTPPGPWVGGNGVTPPGPWVGGNGVTPPGPWVGGNGPVETPTPEDNNPIGGGGPMPMPGPKNYPVYGGPRSTQFNGYPALRAQFSQRFPSGAPWLGPLGQQNPWAMAAQPQPQPPMQNVQPVDDNTWQWGNPNNLRRR